MSQSLWFNANEKSVLIDKIRTEFTKFIKPDSPANSFVGLMVDFVYENLINDNTARYLPEWSSVVSSLFLEYLKKRIGSIYVQNPDNPAVTISLVDLSAEHGWDHKINLLVQTTTLDEFFNQFNGYFPSYLEDWRLPKGKTIDAVISGLLDSIVLKKIAEFYSKDREANYLRQHQHLSIGNFMNSLSPRGNVDNLRELNDLLSHLLDEYALIYKQSAKIFIRDAIGVKEARRTLKLNFPSRTFQISMKESVYYHLEANGGDTLTDDDKDRLVKEFLKKAKESLDFIKDLQPSNVLAVLQQQGIPEWQSFIENKTPLHYYSINGDIDSDTITITINDNFSVIKEKIKELVRLLMNLADLKPLNKSIVKYSEFDGSGMIDIERSLTQIMKTGTFSFIQKIRENFREKDRANMAFILDVTSSMDTSGGGIDVCAYCGASKMINCQHYQNQKEGESVFIVSPPFRYAQLMLSIILIMVQDFMREAVFGVIVNEPPPLYVFTNPELLLYNIWNYNIFYQKLLGSKNRDQERKYADFYLGDGTNYKTLGDLKENHAQFFDGQNKKFVFILTDANIGDTFAGFSIEKKHGRGELKTNSFPYLRAFASDPYINFIFLPITDFTKQTHDNVGFRAIDQNVKINPFENNVTKSKLILYLLNEFRENDSIVGEVAKHPEKWKGVASITKRTIQVKDDPKHPRASINNVLLIQNFREFLSKIKRIIKYDSREMDGVMSKNESETREAAIDISAAEVGKRSEFKINIADGEELDETSIELTGRDAIECKYYKASGLVKFKVPERDPSFTVLKLQYIINKKIGVSIKEFIQQQYKEIAYHIFFYENWDKIFITDYPKLATVGELQRFVNMVKRRNLLDLRSTAQ